MNDKSKFTFFLLTEDSAYLKKARFTGCNSHITPPRIYFLVERDDGTKIVLVFLNTIANPFLIVQQTQTPFLCVAKVGRGRYKKTVNSPEEDVIKVTVYYNAAATSSSGNTVDRFDTFINRLTLSKNGG